MSGAITDNSASGRSEGLSKEKIQQLLAAVGSGPAEDTTQIEATEYDWRQPRYFDSDQLKKLDDFTKKAAAAISEKFTALCHSDFNVIITSTTQHFAAELLGQNSEDMQNDYYLTFGADRQRPCGLVGIAPRTAAIWARQLLGDTDSEKDSDGNLSQLEESLLLDIAFAILKALAESGPLSTAGVRDDFQTGKSIVRGQPRLLLTGVEGIEELCKISFSVEKADSEKAGTDPPAEAGAEDNSEAYLLIPCSRLELLIDAGGGKNARADNKFSADDVSKAILEHLEEMSVSVTAQLASTVLTFEEIMGIGVDDILLLDKRIDEPVELIIEGRTIFRGRPAKSDGRYAVAITETSS